MTCRKYLLCRWTPLGYLPALAALVLLGSQHKQATAVVLFQDDFSYSDGNLVGNGSWDAHSASGQEPVQVVAGQMVLTQENVAGGEEDVEHPLSQFAAAGDTFYYAFDVVVNQFPDSNLVNQGYFAHFSVDALPASESFFGARTFIRSSPSGVDGDYTFGLRTNSGSSPVHFEVGFLLGQSYRVVAAYDYDSGDSTLWIDPTSESSLSISEPNLSIATDEDYSQFPIDRINFRQGGGTGDTTQTIDNLIVATTFAEVIGQAPVIDADFNGDTVVDANDYALWRDSLGATGLNPYDLGDANGDGTVDDADYAAWRSSYNAATGLQTQPTSVPEPASLLLLSAFATSVAVWRRR